MYTYHICFCLFTNDYESIQCLWEFPRKYNEHLCEKRVVHAAVEHWPGLYLIGSSKVYAATEENQECGCASRESSDQPMHLLSLIRVFSVRMKKVWIHSYALEAQLRLIRLGECTMHAHSCHGSIICFFST